MERICANCGRKIADGVERCFECGGKAIEPTVPSQKADNWNDEERKSRKLQLIIGGATAAGVLLIAVLIISMILTPADNYELSDLEKPKEVHGADYGNGERENGYIDTPEEAKEEEKKIERTVSYAPGYTYKRMSDIHSSKEATDEEFLKMQELITSYNNAWIKYVNSNDNAVFGYLRSGTEAYRNAAKYAQKDITEEYVLMEFCDARKTNACYYVWAHEIIDVYADTYQRKEYHWVYQIKKDNGGYYVADYTADPAYK